MSDPVVQATDIVKFLGQGARKVQALRGVSLSLNGGELVLLMGPSGSGKTTLLSVLGCMLSPNMGSVRVCGHATAGLAPEQLTELRRDHIGFVFQSYHLFPTLTAMDNVRLALDVRGDYSRRVIERAKEALATVGLSHKTRSYPLQLSSGEQQRVAIARENGHAVMSILANIARQETRGVLVVTHDPRILPFAHRIIHIEDGRIIRKTRNGGTPTQL